MNNFKTKDITYFEKPGKENTDKAIELAIKRLKEGDIKKVVIASSFGETSLKFIEAIKKEKQDVQVIPVLTNAGSKFAGTSEQEDNKRELKKRGIRYIQGIQAFSGIERAINKRWGTVGPVMLISDALRLISEGVKVSIEVTTMATDAGFVSPNEMVMSIAGTSRGADTVVILKPSYSHKFFDFAVREIVCKPLVEGVKHEAR